MNIMNEHHRPWLPYRGTKIKSAIKYIIKLCITVFRIIFVLFAPINTPSRWNDKNDISGDKIIQGIYNLISMRILLIGVIKVIIL